MALRINSPVSALKNMSSLRKTQGKISDSLRRISTGVRVEVAADDPGRLGSTLLAEAKLRGLRQSIRNLNDGLSLTQTLEGGLSQITAALQRLRELSVQAGNETYNAADREALQAEASQMIQLIDKAVEQTKFNGIGLLDGSARNIEIFVDQPSGEVGSLNVGLLKVDTTEMSRRAHYESERRGVYLGTLANGDLKINGVDIRGTTETDDELSVSYKAGSAIAKAKAINSASHLTGVTARVTENVITANRAIGPYTLDSQNFFSINGHLFSGFKIENFDADGKLRDAINSAHQATGVKAQLDSLGQLQLIAEDGRNIQIKYSNLLTMLSIGLADTSGDEVNLDGDVSKSSLEQGNPASNPSLNPSPTATSADYFGTIQHINKSYDDNNSITSFDIGGSFDPGVDNIDYVVQFIKGGPLGTAEFRIISETANETETAQAAEGGPGVDGEDFSFLIETVSGSANGPIVAGDVTGVSGAYFTPADGADNNSVLGSVVVAGTYNEAPDRVYTLTVVSAGSTDGPQDHARIEVTTDVDGAGNVIAAFTIQSGVAFNIGDVLNQTGENLTVTFGDTPRGESISSNVVAAQEYNATFRQNVNGTTGTDIVLASTFGDFTGDVNMTKVIEVVSTGYTQGSNLAELRVTNQVGSTITVSKATFAISADTDIDIGDGLLINFPTQAPTFVGINSGDVIIETGGGSGSYEAEHDVTLTSPASAFIGERGDGTYILDVTKAGIIGTAEYQVLFDDGTGPVVIAGTVTRITTGANNSNPLADGLTVGFEASTPSIGGTSNSSITVVAGDDYGDSAAAYDDSKFFFDGTYDGALNDATVEVKVTQEGRVLDGTETNEDDAAVLTYTITGSSGAGSITGTTLARTGSYNLGSGVQFNITDASAVTQIQSPDGTQQGNSYTLDPNTLGYDGQISLQIDHTAVTLTKDADIRITNVSGSVIVGDGVNTTPTGTIRVELLDEDNPANVLSSTELTNIVSGTTYTVADGVELTFTNAFTAATISSTGVANDDGGTGDFASVSIGAGAYNDLYGDDVLAMQFLNVPSASVSASEGANTSFEVGATAGTLTGGYTGNFGTQSLNVTFNGTSVSTPAVTVNGGADDNANLTTIGTYGGADGDVTLNVQYVAPVFSVAGTGSVSLSQTGGPYSGLDGDKSLTVTFDGTLTDTEVSSNPAAFTISYLEGGHSWALNDDSDIVGTFVSASTISMELSIEHDGTSHTFSVAPGAQTIDLSTKFGAGYSTLNLDVHNDAALAIGDTFTIDITENQSIRIQDASTGFDLGNIAIPAGGGDINLSGLNDGSVDLFTNSPGFQLNVTESTTGAADSFTVTLEGPKATVNGQLTSIASGSINLGAATFSSIFTSDPGVDLSIANPTNATDDEWTVELTTLTTVDLQNVSGGGVVTVDVSSGSLDLDADLSAAEKTTLFGSSIEPGGATSVGLELSFTDVDKLVDDVFTVDMVKTPTLRIENPNGGSSVVVAVPPSNTIDLNNLFGAGQDPGFDLNVTNAINGFDDTFNLTLRTGDVTATANTIAALNVRSMQVDDTFTADLTGDVLEVGDQYSVQVEAPHLNAGTTYTITENVDRLEVGDTMTIDVDSAFEPTVYTAQSSVTITNGLTLDFDAGSTFDVGDELRFQASGYRGGFSVFGQYTDPAFPTTIEVEVITEGDVDGGAVLRARRADGGPIDDSDPSATFIDFNAVSTAQTLTVGGDGYIGKGVFIQFDPHANFQPDGSGDAHRLYKGDKFYLDVIGSLSQNFASRIVLESDKNIHLEYSDTNVDNKLGRFLYVGDESAVNNPGTIGSLSKAVLGVNTEFSIAKLDLSSQEGAEDALVIIDHAIGRIDEKRTRMGAMQNRITTEINALSEAAFQTERYGSRIKDADMAHEVAELSSAQIRQQAGIDILRQINDAGNLSLLLVDSLIR